MLIAAQNNLGIMSADVSNAFCTGPCTEKIWSTASGEFGKKLGAILVLKRALCGLKTALRLFPEFLGD